MKGFFFAVLNLLLLFVVFQTLEENTIGQQNLHRYIQKRSYEQSPMLNAMYNSDQQMKQIVQAPLLTPDEKSTLYSNELHRF